MLTKSEIKYIQSLSQKKFRKEEGLFVIEGPKIVEEALLMKSVKIDKILALEDWYALNTESIGSVKCDLVAEHELQKISQLKTPNQVIALVKLSENREEHFDKSVLSLALDGVQDPGNLGTIVRIADWFGIHQIICGHDTADAYNSKVIQASMGSIFRVKFFYTDLEEWMRKNEDVLFYGAALDGNPLNEFPKLEKGVIVIGNESKGIRPGVMSRLSEKITIKRWGDAESLNAAVATGIILSHIR